MESSPPPPSSIDVDGLFPEWLAERVRILRDGDLRTHAASGEIVLYWMHHAVRAHENPALDAARLVAADLGLPLIVYQGLGGNHPFNNDRHHTFIMQGTCDVAADLAARGLRHVFWLPTRPQSPSPLHALAKRSAAIVTEDFPVPPFPKWTQHLAERCQRPTLMVDTACVVPMRIVHGTHDRAFRFRNKTKKLFERRADRPYPDVDVADIDASQVDVGFEPCDLERLDIPEVCAQCEIDHSVAPVAHTRGGSAAGYARWNAFKSSGLGRYHRRRNTAEIEREAFPVSRMSPYLHHGHVSPFRLIRETREMLDGPAADGAEKYIDELWVWRELAHHLAFTRTDDLHDTRIIPEWARRTIADHANDARTLFDRDTLARAQTGDDLWDAAQRSLLAHGELHNNVRMTWGKAMLGWHMGAAATQASLIDLNHRFALDGNDPNSYGGLLWCLGVFDRPFDHDEPIYGSLRTRSTTGHANRMDFERYETQVTRTNWDKPLRVAVIGAGIAGLAAARVLADHNVDVTVFEANRDAGGRMQSGGRDDRGFDHGAQYFTARDPRFRRIVDAWTQRGVVAEWKPRLASIDEAGAIVPKPGSADQRFVGVPTMSAICTHLAETVGGRSTLRFGTRVKDIQHGESGWTIGCADDARSPATSTEDVFDALIVAVPAPAALALLEGHTALTAQIASVQMHPCWAAMLAFDQALPVDADGVFVNIKDGPLSWACRDSSKPGRARGERWVLHGSPDWSRDAADLDPSAVAAHLLDALQQATGLSLPAPTLTESMYWPAALGANATPTGMLFDRATRLAVAGDWCAGGRVEGAYLSGVAAAGRLLGEIVATSGVPNRVPLASM